MDAISMLIDASNKTPSPVKKVHDLSKYKPEPFSPGKITSIPFDPMMLLAEQASIQDSYNNMDRIGSSYGRPRSYSEPWISKEWSSRLLYSASSNTDDFDATLPHNSSKYSSTYNKNGRIGIYTPDERKEIINRFREKKKRRVWSKKIRYNCRKSLADRRIRIKGRFVKAEEMEELNMKAGLSGSYYANDDTTKETSDNKYKEANSEEEEEDDDDDDNGVGNDHEQRVRLESESTVINNGISGDELPAKRLRRHSIAY